MSLRNVLRGGRGLFPLLSVFLLCIACRGEGPSGDPSLVLELGISPTPPAVGPARLIITLEDTAGVGLADALIVAEGNMTHAGMLPVVDTARMQSPGHYFVPSFGFTMAGDWIITLDATLPDGRGTRLQRATGVVSAVSPDHHAPPEGRGPDSASRGTSGVGPGTGAMGSGGGPH